MIIKNNKKTILFSAIFILLIPLGLNFLLQLSIFNVPIIGDERLWLSFWGTYCGVIISGLITLFVLNETIKNNNTKNNELKSLQIRILEFQNQQVRIDRLVSEINSNMHFVSLNQLRDYSQTLELKLEEAELFFNQEMSEKMYGYDKFKVSFASKNPSDEENEYLQLFKDITDNYCKILLVFIRTIILLKRDNLEDIIKLRDKVDDYKDIIPDNIWSYIQKSKNKETASIIIIDNVNVEFLKYTQTYQNQFSNLARIAGNYIEHEREIAKNKITNE